MQMTAIAALLRHAQNFGAYMSPPPPSPQGESEDPIKKSQGVVGGRGRMHDFADTSQG